MLDQYMRFFAASATASAGFSGLLFVALSVVNRDESEHRTRERRTVLAASAFLALIDVFFVSIVSSLWSSVVLATVSLVMAVVGLLGTSRLMPRARRAGNFAHGFPKRRLNLAFAAVSAGGFGTQLGLALALLADAGNAGLVRALVFLIVALFVSALSRAWEVAGIGHRSLREELASTSKTANEADASATATESVATAHGARASESLTGD